MSVSHWVPYPWRWMTTPFGWLYRTLTPLAKAWLQQLTHAPLLLKSLNPGMKTCRAGKTTKLKPTTETTCWQPVPHPQAEAATDPQNPWRKTTYPGSSAALAVFKEPAFIAAIVLTVVILIGGVILTKLGSAPFRLKRKRGSGGRSTMDPPSMARSRTAPPAGVGAEGTSQVAVIPSGGDISCETPTSHQLPHRNSPRPEASGELGLTTRSTGGEHGDSFGGLPRTVQPEPEDSFRDIGLKGQGVYPEIEDNGGTPVAGVMSEDIQAAKPDPPESWRHRKPASDESHGTQDSDPANLFSSTSSLSTSVTSVSNDGAVEDGDDSLDEVDQDLATNFEVKRGQAHSIELAMGVLLSLAASASTKDIVEVARKEEQLPQAVPVPAVIVTEPSTLSFTTIGSSASNVSVELGQFPLPPLHLEPAVFWAKLEDEINTSLALKQRRSGTWEQPL
ncbi:hypothetical protein DFP72DRAFT_1096045 [Ephemerocybe angulata]|uniref:Transmembrane protein n=1 Tax=Ephemerocybe angulata TaxID=980116 RepID=A0A8H6I702_9AGAR|nr:hypothetical protein DFP72DRAFT_1096045 [Tulosesus angulatus]